MTKPIKPIKRNGLLAKGIIGGTAYAIHPHTSLDPCVYCGGRADSDEHIIPRSCGGQGANNKARACHACNQARSSKPLLLYLWERHTKERQP